jgi:hypothetical protein
MPPKKSYHDNFIAAVKLIMADQVLDSTKAAAEYLGINYMSMWKIMDGTNKPTVDQGILLCIKGNFSANWMFLSKGEVYYQEALTLTKMSKQLDSIDKLIKKRG